MAWFETAGLSLTVFLPVVGALALFAFPKANEAAQKWTALLVSGLTGILAVLVAVAFDYGSAERFQFEVMESWIPAIGANYHIGVDGISLPLLVLSAVVTFLAVVYSWDHWEEPRNVRGFLALMLLLETGMNGTFVALDLVLFFIFFELVLLPMYFMIGIWGDSSQRRIPVLGRTVTMRLYAAIKFFIFTLFGSAFMLLGFLALYFRSGDFLPDNTFDIPTLIALGADNAFGSGTFAFLVFGAMFLGFAVKVPMWPFHTWLPDAHTAAPTVGSVLLAAILLKLGSYAFLRISIPILPDMAREWAPFIGLLAVIGIIYGSLACLAQTDVKRLIAFSSVGHMGFVMLGIATMTDIGFNAALIGMVAHGLITGAAVLPGRVAAPSLPHQGDLPPRWQPETDALDGRHPRLHRHGVAGAPRAGRLLGRVHVAGGRLPSPVRSERFPVPDLHGDRRRRHRPHRRIHAMDAPAGQPGRTQPGMVGPRVSRCGALRVVGVGASDSGHRRHRRVPEDRVRRHHRRRL